MQWRGFPFMSLVNRSTVLPSLAGFFFFLIRMQIRRQRFLATEVIYSKAFCMWYKWTYLQKRRRLTEVENLRLPKEKGWQGRDKSENRNEHIRTSMHATREPVGACCAKRRDPHSAPVLARTGLCACARSVASGSATPRVVKSAPLTVGFPRQ